MRIILHGKNFEDTIKDTVQKIITVFLENDCHLLISTPFHKHLLEHHIHFDSTKISTYTPIQDQLQGDFAFTIGGDGTFLEIVTHIQEAAIPIAGVNTGRLGFLATLSLKNLQNALTNLTSNQYTISERTLLQIKTHPTSPFGNLNFALNDLTISKTQSSSMIKISTLINDNLLNHYWADGLLVSTPTGSTAYSLSCGGPLVVPECQNFIINPICPHNLTVRPLVVSDDSKLTIKVESRSGSFLISLDSRSVEVENPFEIKVQKAPYKIKILQTEKVDFFHTLREKLQWGYDVRK